MCMHGPNIVVGAVQMDTTLLRYASVIMEQKTCQGVFLSANPKTDF